MRLIDEQLWARFWDFGTYWTHYYVEPTSLAFTRLSEIIWVDSAARWRFLWPDTTARQDEAGG